MASSVLFIVVVVVVLLSYWLSCWLSCCCSPLSRIVVVATTADATAKPPMRSGRCHCHNHLHHRCHCNRIRCSYHRRPHLAAAFTALVNTEVISQRRRINDANSLNAAIACYRHYRWSSPWPPPLSLPSPLHLLQPLLLPSPSPPLSPSPQPPLTSPPALVWRCLTLGLAVTTARQGTAPKSSRHGREVWKKRGLNL